MYVTPPDMIDKIDEVPHSLVFWNERKRVCKKYKQQ